MEDARPHSRTSCGTILDSISPLKHSEILESLKDMSEDEVDLWLKRLEKNKRSYEDWIEKKNAAEMEKMENEVKFDSFRYLTYDLLNKWKSKKNKKGKNDKY